MSEYRVTVAHDVRQYDTYYLELPDELAERLSDLQDSDDGQEAYRLLEGVPRWGYGFESTESTDCDEPNLNITIDGM